jgi:ABC-type sugar transport system substrate-binding protein
MRKRVAMLLVPVLGLTFAACGDDDDSADEASGTTAAPEAAESTDAPAATDAPGATDAPAATDGSGSAATCDGGGAKIGLVLHVRLEITQQIADGAQVAADECNVELDVVGPTGVDAQAAIAAFQSEIAAGADAMVVIAFPDQNWNRPLDEAYDAGMPIVMSNVATKGSKVKTFVGIDGYDEFHAEGEMVANALGADATGDVIVGTCAPGDPVINQRFAGVSDAFAEIAPDVNVEGPFDLGFDLAQVSAAAQTQVQANPDALAFIGLCENEITAWSDIKERTGAEWLVAGGNINEGTVRGLENGTIMATVSQNAYMQGYLPIRLLVDHLQTGDPLPEGWLNPGWEIITSENHAETLPRNTDATLAAEYQADRVADILANPSEHFRPLDEVYGDQ